MQLTELVAAARNGKSTVYAFERGKATAYPFAQLAADAEHTQARLEAWGVRKGMRVGIYAPNSYPWLVHDLALIRIGAVSVPFTDDFAGQVNQALLDRYDIALLLLAKRHAKLFAPCPDHVAFLDDENGAVAALPRMPAAEADSGDHHSLVFSSGSAGGLKGLVISRKGVEDTLPPIIDAIGAGDSAGDSMQLFLPMSNFQQRNMCYAAIWNDYDIIITDYTQLFAAMRALNPTILIAPPVLFEMIYSEFSKLPAWKRAAVTALGNILALFPRAVRLKLSQALLPDLLGQFGSRMRRLVTGMAPIRRDIGRFFEQLGLPLCESYGMVEAGSITFRPAHSREYGSVGTVLDGIRLSFQEDGEIHVHRDHPLTLRYFQCADGENARTFVAPGIIATGDIGRLDAKGNLFLQGRKKEQIITPGGLKIHPEVIERELNACGEVARCIVFLKPGASQLTCVVDMVQPEADGARDRAKKFATGMKSIRGAFQHVDVVFAPAPFSVENGMLRPNMKVDRKKIAATYT
jgi:long-subunit acyl-CoA synthetase (AMP-forming)